MTNETKAHDLLRAMGLTIVKDGAGGRYPCAEPGPVAGYRYWATHTEGRFKLGVQHNPKRELHADLQHRLQARGFLLTPKRTEGFVWLEGGLGDSLDLARAAARELRDIFANG